MLADRDFPTTCGCGEARHEDQPCRCQREQLRAMEVPAAEGLTDACADSQHYACSGYVREPAGWRRCPCTCHPLAAAA